MLEIRLRQRVPEERIRKLKGKLVGYGESDLAIVGGPLRVLLPRGRPLCVYLPGHLADVPQDLRDAMHATKYVTQQRMTVGGAGQYFEGSMRRGKKIHSATAGYMETQKGGLAGNFECRETHWTGLNGERFRSLWPILERIDAAFREHVPDRWTVQKRHWDATPEEYRIPGTTYTTFSINNTFAAGIHQDSGDLEIGFSSLAVFRRGEYRGCELTFPAWRVRVDMQDGDLLLMDANEWHGNTPLEKLSEDAGRISLVSYFRTEMTRCPTAGGEDAHAG